MKRACASYGALVHRRKDASVHGRKGSMIHGQGDLDFRMGEFVGGQARTLGWHVGTSREIFSQIDADF